MARFDGDANGTILKVVPNYGNELHPTLGSVPEGRVYVLQLDEVTNAGILAAYTANPSQFAMPGGTLTQTVGGVSQAATINPPTPFYAAFQNSAAIMARLNGGQYAPTQEELSQIAAAAFRANGFPV